MLWLLSCWLILNLVCVFFLGCDVWADCYTYGMDWQRAEVMNVVQMHLVDPAKVKLGHSLLGGEMITN